MNINMFWNSIRKSVNHRWNQIKSHTLLKQTHFDNILQFCLDSLYCDLNNDFYKQIFGSPLSAVAANIVMEEIEKKIVLKLPYQIIFYFRYIDDTLLCLLRAVQSVQYFFGKCFD